MYKTQKKHGVDPEVTPEVTPEVVSGARPK